MPLKKSSQSCPLQMFTWDSEKSDMSTHHTDETDEKSLSRQGSNVSLSSNTLCKGVYDNFRGSHPLYEDTVLTIEGLHLYLNSCFTCGVYWKADHVTIGCNECGGYGLKRPCPECDGQCQVMWKRNLTMSHSNHRAKWSGECGFKSKDSLEENLTPALEKLTTTP
ncbi:uncharacterized protein Pino isoform X2 [Chelonus insularis]|uniref:uncharacterized protein Pino isoform X2 n=1 Tax=Chelonus insularis TaxID=460826 RepID=UPI00158ECB70|nr:uncharacterized protein LOC118064075 isoform X2 [Chelonus insularis]